MKMDENKDLLVAMCDLLAVDDRFVVGLCCTPPKDEENGRIFSYMNLPKAEYDRDAVVMAAVRNLTGCSIEYVQEFKTKVSEYKNYHNIKNSLIKRGCYLFLMITDNAYAKAFSSWYFDNSVSFDYRRVVILDMICELLTQWQKLEKE
jgi:hypothetical protein